MLHVTKRFLQRYFLWLSMLQSRIISPQSLPQGTCFRWQSCLRLHVARPSGANRDGGNPSPKKRQIIDKKDKTIRKEWKGSLTSTKLDAVEISIVFEDGDNTEVLVGKMAEEEL